MNPRRISIILISLGIGFSLGYLADRLIRQNSTNGEVQCLLQMWGDPLTSEQYENVNRLKSDPSAVRYYLLDQLKNEHWISPGNYISKAVDAENGESTSDLSRTNKYKPRAALLLQLWERGQSDIAETRKPSGNLKVFEDPSISGIQDTAFRTQKFTKDFQFWNLYLTDPDSAWLLGVDEFGRGGKIN